MTRLDEKLKVGGFKQLSQLTSTQRFDATRQFTLTDIVANSNENIGRTVRKKFPPKAKKVDRNDPLYSMLEASGKLALTLEPQATNGVGNTGHAASGTSSKPSKQGNSGKSSKQGSS